MFTRLCRFVFLGVVTSVLIACGGEKPASTIAAGVGVPVRSEKWEVTVTQVRTMSAVSCVTETGAYSSSAVDPYTYLIVDATIRSLDVNQEASVSSSDGSLITADNQTIPASGGGTDAQGYCGSQHVYFNTEKTGFVFLVDQNQIDQEFKFQYSDVPPVPFKVKP